MNRYLAYLSKSTKKFLKKSLFFADYLKDYFLFKKLSSKTRRDFGAGLGQMYPCLGDKTEDMGSDFHYVYHPAWAARIIAKNKPKFHVDISSILYFSTIVSAFVPVKYYEYRKVNMNLENLSCGQADLLSLPFGDNSVESISCMHTVEHIGLGRYGDKIDPNGDLKAINELKRVVAHGGSLLFVVPIGKPKIYFNAHRVYSYEQIMDYFLGMELKEFALIPKGGKLIYNAPKEMADKEDYGCGCFWFIKK